jgi:glycosyltransferase involved in cell wall biosynthesis
VKISVAIPAYNCASTIRFTLDSVFRQTVQPDEILVLNDGSTDETLSILKSYEPRITILSQTNQGVASARNALCKQAQGDLVAWIDSDDIWHPRYLEIQRSVYLKNPHAVAQFTGHVNFVGEHDYGWDSDPAELQSTLEIIPPLQFLKRYSEAPGPFMCISHCCIPKRVFDSLGAEPFKLRMAEDLYFFNMAVPAGPVVFLPKPMVAYRVRQGSLSCDRLTLAENEVNAFELLVPHYTSIEDKALRRIFKQSFAMKRRLLAKFLLGAGKVGPARYQLRRSLTNGDQTSKAKSLGLLLFSYLPPSLQPKWPTSQREWTGAKAS